jgi:hypothetical protein
VVDDALEGEDRLGRRVAVLDGLLFDADEITRESVTRRRSEHAQCSRINGARAPTTALLQSLVNTSRHRSTL